MLNLIKKELIVKEHIFLYMGEGLVSITSLNKNFEYYS